MAGNTKNVGQVSGVYIGNTPPENIILIWYDNTPSQMVHKVYNPGLSQWVVLDQNVISSITYSEIVNIATNVGLTVGQWFKITDKSNALALAVTSTKVQYSDSLGNILIDDLGSNIQYHVSSSNLSIDDVVGVFDEVNKKLVFQFSEQVPDYTADDYILGKVKRNNVWSLAKFKLSSFLSKVTGNSITWNGGFFFNFSSAISNILDKKGGVVSKDTYDIDKQNIATDIQNVGKENQTIIENANEAITNATSSTAIYDKQTPAVETGGEPTDVATGDKLITIVSKFQRYINKFKFATGIKISKNFKDGTTPEYINNNDTVESAFQKVQYWFKHIGSVGKLSDSWVAKDYTGTVEDVAAGDTLDEAFAKAQAKLNQIGDITKGKISSKQKFNDTPATEFNLDNKSLKFNYGQSSHNNYDNFVELSNFEGLNIKNRNGYGIDLKGSGMTFNAPANSIYNNGVYSGALFKADGSSAFNTYAALQAVVSGSGRNIFDAYFSKLKLGIMTLENQTVSGGDITVSNKASFIVGIDSSAVRNVYLPNNPPDGTMVYATKASTQNLNIYAQGTEMIDNIGSEVQYVTLTDRGHVLCFVYIANIHYNEGTTGLWLYFRWSH